MKMEIWLLMENIFIMVDFSIDTNSAIKISDRDLVLQQIDILFDTIPGEVLGQETFGTMYDKFLYNLQITNEGVRQQVLNDLNSINLMGYTPEVEVYLTEGTEHDIALINITLKRNQETVNRTYKIS